MVSKVKKKGQKQCVHALLVFQFTRPVWSCRGGLESKVFVVVAEPSYELVCKMSLRDGLV